MIRFPLGHVVITPGCLAAFHESGDDPSIFVLRHATGNWGDLTPADRQANEEALKVDARLLSAYRLSNGTKIWIITEADRASTCLLLPDEY
jgi:hypothetical protein